MPTVTRAELNRAPDIIREFRLRQMHRAGLSKPYVTMQALSGCDGKKAFRCKPAADRYIRRGCVSYRCGFCRQWHVGNVNKG